MSVSEKAAVLELKELTMHQSMCELELALEGQFVLCVCKSMDCLTPTAAFLRDHVLDEHASA